MHCMTLFVESLGGAKVQQDEEELSLDSKLLHSLPCQHLTVVHCNATVPSLLFVQCSAQGIKSMPDMQCSTHQAPL